MLLGQAALEPWRLAPNRILAGPLWGARVRIQGPWRGSLCLRLEEELARQLARRLFGAETKDLQDAVGEMANILAGHFKAGQGIELHLSMPSPCKRERKHLIRTR
jgi:hypothetical protein